jgi:hypothetical protein
VRPKPTDTGVPLPALGDRCAVLGRSLCKYNRGRHFNAWQAQPPVQHPIGGEGRSENAWLTLARDAQEVSIVIDKVSPGNALRPYVDQISAKVGVATSRASTARHAVRVGR